MLPHMRGNIRVYSASAVVSRATLMGDTGPKVQQTLLKVKMWGLIGICALCAIGHLSHVALCAINCSHHFVFCADYISRSSPCVGHGKFIRDIALGTSASFHGVDRTYLHQVRHSRWSKHLQVLVMSDILTGEIAICLTILSLLRPCPALFVFLGLIGVDCAL